MGGLKMCTGHWNINNILHVDPVKVSFEAALLIQAAIGLEAQSSGTLVYENPTKYLIESAWLFENIDCYVPVHGSQEIEGRHDNL